jgi:hypothetical protein
MRIHTLAVLAVTAAIAAPRLAAADAATEARLRDALRSATTQLRTAEDERAKADASATALKKELDAAKAQLVGARRVPAKSAQCVENERKAEELARRLAEQQAAATAAQEQCQATASQATRSLGEERSRQQAETASAREKLAASEARNQRMYEVGKSIIDWLSRKGFGEALAAREPFLGLKRVELENVAQDYEDKLLEQKARP